MSETVTTPKSLEEWQQRLSDIETEMRELDTEFAMRAFTDEAKARFEELKAEKEDTKRTITELETRQAWLADQATNDRTTESGAEFSVPRPNSARGDDIYDTSTIRSIGSEDRQSREFRDRAYRAVERCEPAHPVVDEDTQRASAERLVKKHQPENNRLDRYLLATGNPVYASAFRRWLEANGQTSSFTREESLAWEEARQAERALSLTGSSGGFAVPFELDTTILLTSNGVINPIRQLARVRQITVDEWRGLSTAGVTFSYAAEATETTDNAPTLAQPTVSTERAQGWIPFSIEIDMDWSSMRADLAEAIQDGKDTLEAGKFISGTGTNEPFGVLTGTTTTVAAATGLTVTLANLYSLKNALPPRYRRSNSAAFLADVAILDRFRQFDTVGSSAAIWVDSLQQGLAASLLGYPVYEASEMAETITNGTKIALFGDFSRYLIADRVGLTVDFIPHVFGANQRPTGQRGLYVFFRNGAKVLDANAFRALTGTT